MARKHEKFSCSYGWRTAPEQWRFYWNGKPINLETSIQSNVACLMLAGKEIEAEAILKRLLRKQEKEPEYICIGFWDKAKKRYYFTQQLKCRSDDFQAKLYAYKEWKGYIKERNCTLSTITITSGYLMSDGKMSNETQVNRNEEIDIKNPVIIHLIGSDKVFQF